MADSLKQLSFQVSDGLVFPLPEDTLCADLAEHEVFYGDRSNLVEYSNALSSYQRLCSTTPTTPAEYMAWVNQSRSLQKKMSQLEHQDGKFNAELQAAVECYPESYLILSAAFHAVGAGVEESLIRAGRYQVEHPTVPLGAAQHFAAQQVEGPVLAVMNFWENYDAIQYAKAHKEQMPPAAYFQQMGASSVGVATPALAVLGLRAALKSGGGFQGGSLMAAGQDGLALAGVSAAGEGAAVASAGNFFAHSLLTFAKAAEEQRMKTEGEGEASVPLTQVDDPGLLAAEIRRDIELDHPVFVYDITGKFFYNRGEWLVPIVFGIGIGAVITFGLAMCNEAKGKKAQK